MSEQSAIERLRALLDELGAEWEEFHGEPMWMGDDGRWYYAIQEITRYGADGGVVVHHLTPEQAVEATLGRGTCREVYLLKATDNDDGREHVLGVYATEESATAAIGENRCNLSLHHVERWEVE